MKDLCEIAECDRTTLERAIEPFRRRSFLLPPFEVGLKDATAIDVSHEALLRRWTTLKTWIDEDELDRRLYLRIATRAADEAGADRPDYFQMPLLGVLEKFWKDRQPTRAWAMRHHRGYDQARDFLEASGTNQRDVDKTRARSDREALRRARRRAQLRLTFAALVTILAVVGVLLWRYSQTNRNLDVQRQQLAAEVIASKAATTAESDIETRTQLAAEALRRRPTPDAQRLLLQSLLALAKPAQDLPWSVVGDELSLPAF